MKIDAIVIPTKNRPDEALACLASFILVGSSQEFILFDETKEPVQTDLNARIVSNQSTQSFIQLLTRRGLNSNILEFALNGAYGGNRNRVLLETLGRTFLSADDDTRAVLYAPPNQAANVLMRSDGVAHETYWFKDRAQWLEQMKPAAANILKKHEDFLGVATKDGVKTVLTSTGSIGDSGADAWHPTLLARGHHRERLVANYAEVRNTREILQCATSPSLTKNEFFRSFSFGCDNTALLPPFFPGGRGESMIFAKILTKCFPNYCIAHLPWAIKHVPDKAREYLATVEPLGPAAIAAGAIMHLPSGPMADIGRALKAFDKVKPSVFHASVASSFMQSCGAALAQFEAVLKQFDGPEEWVADVRSYIEAFSNPEKQNHVRSEETRRILVNYGKLLLQWPDICEATQELNLKGHRLSY